MEEKIIESTKSICGNSFKVINADVLQRNGRIFLRKKCPEHGEKTSLHIYDIPQLYSEMRRIFCSEATRKAYPHELVAYITTECNFGCPVCYIDANHCKDKELFVDDILGFFESLT